MEIQHPNHESQDFLRKGGSQVERVFNRRKLKYQAAISAFDVRIEAGLVNGPVADRSATDVCFLFIFLGVMGAVVFASLYGAHNGDMVKLFAPQDGEHHMCGVDPGFKDHPFLYIPDAALEDPDELFSFGVCVKECPKSSKAHLDCKPTHKTPHCKSEYASSAIIRYCFPSSEEDLPPGLQLHYSDLKEAIEEHPSSEGAEDIFEAQSSLIICCITALALTIFYMYAMAIFTKALAYLSIAIVEVTVLLGMLGLIGASAKVHDSDSKTAFLIGAGILFFFGLVFNLMLCCFWRHLKVAIAIVGASAEFYAATKRIIFVSMLYSGLAFIGFLLWTVGSVFVLSLSEIKASDEFAQAKSFEPNGFTSFLLFLMVFGLIWGLAFLRDQSRFIYVSSVASYYFSSSPALEGRSDVSGAFSLALFTHAGSIALGSLIHTLFTFLRMMVESMETESRQSDNAAAQVFACVARCIVSCLEDLVEYLSESAYAFMAVSGQPYCQSAWNGFLVNLKHCVKFIFAFQQAKAFVFLGVCSIVALNCSVFYLSAEYLTNDGYLIDSYAGPIFIVIIVTVMIASVFLSLFDDIVMGMLMCVAIDMDLNNGRPQFGPPAFHEKLAEVFDEDKR